MDFLYYSSNFAVMDCVTCRKPIERKEMLVCIGCKGTQHYRCANITSADFREHGQEIRKSFVCTGCMNVTRRIRCDDTPIRKTPVSDDCNMSCDGVLDDPNSTPSTSSYTLAPVVDNNKNPIPSTSNNATPAPVVSGQMDLKVFYNDLGKLLESKFSKMETTITQNIQTSIEKSITHKLQSIIKKEITSAIDTLQTEFTQTTDFLAAEQLDLKKKSDATNDRVKLLEAEKMILSDEITALEKRLRPLEKASRNCNVEVHCVPEKKQENLINIFKSLCEKIEVPIHDTDIGSIRRVAKMDTTSDRPRNILATLKSERLRDSMISAYRNYNKSHRNDPLNTNILGITGESKQIYIAEHLSPEMKELHSKTRKVTKGRYKYVWIQHGNIYVKKTDDSELINIKNSNCLSKLI